MKSLWIIGSGGHARVVMETARATGIFEIAGVLDDDPSRTGERLDGVGILGPISLESMQSFNIRHAVIAIGANHVRQKIASRLDDVCDWATLVHPRAWVAAGSSIGAGSIVLAGTIVQPGARIGRHVILNTQSSVDHDCTIADYVHVAPGSHLAGSVHVEEGAFVGLSAGVIPGKVIGAWSTVGAGAMVINDVAPDDTVVGVPARSIRSRE